MRLRKANPASPSVIDVTAPSQPEPFTPEQHHLASTTLRGIRVLQFMGKSDDDIVQDGVRRLRAARA